MSIAGLVPAAVAGTVDANGVRKGIFESTTIAAGGIYKTKLTFVNVLITPVTKGANAGIGAVEVYDFGKALMVWDGGNIALTALLNDANVTAALFNGLGTVTAIDAVKAAGADNSLSGYSAAATGTYGSGLTVVSDGRSTTSLTAGAPQLVDGTGTASKLFLNLNVTAASITATSAPGITLNGTVEFHYRDLGADL